MRRSMVATKVCHACKRCKPLTAFYCRRASPDGRDFWCRECRANYFRRWRAANLNAYKQLQRAYCRRNRARVRAYNREYSRRRRALMRAGKWAAGA